MADKTMQIGLVLSAYDQMSRVVNQAVNTSLTKVNQFQKSVNQTSSNALSVGIKSAAIGVGMAGMLALPIKAAADLQKQQISLTTAFQGNEAAAKSAFETINKFAAETPYGMEEVLNSFIKLKNLNLSPTEETLRSYGNTASSMGKSLNQMIEAVADASTFEFERLKEFGIKANQEKDRVIFTFQGTQTAVAKNSEAIQQYLLNIGNTKFSGGIERQAESVYGQLSTLEDNVKMTAATMGATLIPQINALFQQIMPVVDGISSWIQSNPELSSGLLQLAAGAMAVSFAVSGVTFAVGGATKILSISTGVYKTAKAGFEAYNTAIKAGATVSKALALATQAMNLAFLGSPITWIVAAIVALGAGIYYAYKHSETFRAVMDGLINIAKVAIDYYGGLWKIIQGIISLDFSKIKEGFAQSANAVKQIYSGDAYKKGYEASIAQSKSQKAQQQVKDTAFMNRFAPATSTPLIGPSKTNTTPLPNRNVSNSSTFNINVNVDGSKGNNPQQTGKYTAEEIHKALKDFKANEQRTSFNFG